MSLQPVRHGPRPGRQRGQEHARGGTSPSGSRNPLPLGRGGCQQRQAAELFGGGVNAFSRYENGKTKPPLALVKLFKLLDRHPDLLSEVRTVGAQKSSRPASLRPGWGAAGSAVGQRHASSPSN